MKIVKVDLGERSYSINIGKGSVNSLTEFLSQRKYSKIFVITDENVAKLHLKKVEKFLTNSESIIIKAGESSKSFASLEKICEEILAKGVDRKSLIIAFGGGVIGDLAGFIASILLRGIDFIQIPTTLLAAVDSSVGGKTAINSKSGKNLIGSFYQPQMVICDLDFLDSLPKRELRSGLAEVIKYGLIRDQNFFEFLEKNHLKIFDQDEEFLSKIISCSCAMKADIVGRDERESGDRMLLNFGHTFGHVFETETDYSDELLHGEAVALGMKMAAKMSQNLGLISEADFNRIALHLENCGFVTDHEKIRKSWDEERLISHLAKDKKNEHNSLTFILLKNIGNAFVSKGVAVEEFKKIINKN